MSQEIKRLTIDISPQTHRRLKTLASFHGVTMKEFLLSKALPEADLVSEETVYLLKSRKNRSRLLAATRRSREKNKTFRTLKELRHALGI